MAAGRECGYEGDSLSDCGHTFSEMEPYDEKTAVKDATALVEMVRSYWMEQAKQAEEREKRPAHSWDSPCSPTTAGTRKNTSEI